MTIQCKRMVVLIVSVMLFGWFSISNVDAASGNKPKRVKAKNSKNATMQKIAPVKVNTQIMVKKECDLAVLDVITEDCICRDCLFAAGYLFPTRVKVLVGNLGLTPASGKVTLTWKDYKTGQTKSQGWITTLLRKDETQELILYIGPIMARKWYGFKAVIYERTSSIPDTNLSNNNRSNKNCLPTVQ